jgi:hypothetical protein
VPVLERFVVSHRIDPPMTDDWNYPDRPDLVDPYEETDAEWSDQDWWRWYRSHHEPVVSHRARGIETVDPGDYL